MTLRDDDMLEETSAAVAAGAPLPDALDDAPPYVFQRDFIQLLLQSPHRLYLYWTFAHDPHDTLREAFGDLAAHYRLAVRLIRVEDGEEFLLDAPRECAQWFDVNPRQVYRAEVGFRAAGRPFVRLLSSNAVTTPPDSASHLSDEAQEFQLAADEFKQLIGGSGYEQYAREFTYHTDGVNINDQGGAVVTAERPDADARVSRLAGDEYPHR